MQPCTLSPSLHPNIKRQPTPSPPTLASQRGNPTQGEILTILIQETSFLNTMRLSLTETSTLTFHAPPRFLSVTTRHLSQNSNSSPGSRAAQLPVEEEGGWQAWRWRSLACFKLNPSQTRLLTCGGHLPLAKAVGGSARTRRKVCLRRLFSQYIPSLPIVD